jgi:hypothetical protein
MGMRVRLYLALFAAFSSVPLALLPACADVMKSGDRTTEDASVVRIRATPKPGPAPTPTVTSPPDASLPPPSDAATCSVDVEEPSILPGTHVPEGTPLAYDSNPPSSGSHYPRWADYEEYTAPVPDGYLVHAIEHGGVLLLYKCEALDAGGGTCASQHCVACAMRSPTTRCARRRSGSG